MSPSGPRRWTLMQKQHLSIPAEPGAGQEFRSTAPVPGSSKWHQRGTLLGSRVPFRDVSKQGWGRLPCTKHICQWSPKPMSLLTLRWFISPGISQLAPQWAASPWNLSSPSLLFNPSVHMDVSVFFHSTLAAQKWFFFPLFFSFWISCSSRPEPSNEVVPLCSCLCVFKNSLWPCVGIHGVPFLNCQAHVGFFGEKGFWNNSTLLWIGEIHKPGEIHKLQETILGVVGLLIFNLRLWAVPKDFSLELWVSAGCSVLLQRSFFSILAGERLML